MASACAALLPSFASSAIHLVAIVALGFPKTFAS
jgi:hypothetical protein